MRVALGQIAMACAGLLGTPAAAQGQKPEAATPPGYTLTGTGDVHDFDYFAGAWTTHQRRLKERGVGSKDWEEFPATLCMAPLPRRHGHRG
jgi:hypothetical protein